MHVAIAQWSHQLDVHASREESIIDDGLFQSLCRKLLSLQPRQHGCQVGISHVYAQTGIFFPRHGCGGHANYFGRAHLHRDLGRVCITRMDSNELGTRPSADGELIFVHQTARAQPVGEYAGSVAAHFGHGAIGIAVIHEPIIGRNALDQFGDFTGCEQSIGAHDAQQTIASDTGAAIAQRRYALGTKRRGSRVVFHDDEVIFSSMTLGKFHVPYPSARNAWAAVSPAASSHVMRLSRLNQER